MGRLRCSLISIIFGISSTTSELPPLWLAFDDVLSQESIEGMRSDIFSMHNAGRPLSPTSKTHWLSLYDASPRNFIEAAVFSLLKCTEQIGGENILGAEWWIQTSHGPEETFQYSTSETLSMKQDRTRHPFASSITYLTVAGEPIVVFNMTTRGGKSIPEIPNRGFIVYPAVGRHIIFQGDLLYETMPSIGKILPTSSTSSSTSSTSSSTLSDVKIVLRINWWSEDPLNPDSVSVTDASTKASNIFYPDRFLDASFTNEVSVCSVKLSAYKMTISDSESSKRHIFMNPVNEYMAMYLPESFPESNQVFDVHFSPRAIYGALGDLDLKNNLQISVMFRSKRPKLFVVFDDTRTSIESFKELLDVLFPLTKHYLKFLKVYMCPYSRCFDVLNVFQIDRSALPRALIHDTVNDEKYVQRPNGIPPKHGAGSGATITRESMEIFLKESLGYDIFSVNAETPTSDFGQSSTSTSASSAVTDTITLSIGNEKPGKAYNTKEVDAILNVGQFSASNKKMKLNEF